MAWPIPQKNANAIFLVCFYHQIFKTRFFCATPKKFFTAKTTLLQSHQNLPPKMTQQRISDSERPRNRSKLTQVLVERRHLSERVKVGRNFFQDFDFWRASSQLFETFGEAPTRWFKVIFWYPSWRSLCHSKCHLTHVTFCSKFLGPRILTLHLIVCFVQIRILVCMTVLF